MRKSQMTWLHPRPNGLKEAIQNREGRENDESTLLIAQPVKTPFFTCIAYANRTRPVQSGKASNASKHSMQQWTTNGYPHITAPGIQLVNVVGGGYLWRQLPVFFSVQV